MEFRSESWGPDGLDPSIGFRWVEHRGPTTVATCQQVDQLNAEGYFVIERAFHPDTMDDVTSALAIETGEFAVPFEARLDDSPTSVLRRFCGHPILAGLARDFIGPDARVGGDVAVVRRPGVPTSPAFTQDMGTTRLNPSQFITAWVALTDATVDNGCLQVVRGRHRAGVLRRDLAPWTDPSGLADIDPRDVIDVEVPAGSVVVMSSLTPRRVRPNVTRSTGVAYAIQYLRDLIDASDHTTVADTHRQFPVVRGGQLVGPS